MPREMPAQEKDICRELANLHLQHLGADIMKPAVADVVEMIYKDQKFRERMEKIVKTPIEKVTKSLPNDNAGTRAKSFLQERRISDVEGLVRLRDTDKYGFGPETAKALRRALEICGLRFGMLFPKPLSAGPAEESSIASE